MPHKLPTRVLSQPSSGNRRVPCAELCEIEDDQGGRQAGRIWNVSAAGVYLVAQPASELTESLTLSFRLPGDAGPIKVCGRIAWWNRPSPVPGLGEQAPHLPPGCGVQYLDLAPRDRHRIEDWVKQALPGPSDPDEG